MANLLLIVLDSGYQDIRLNRRNDPISVGNYINKAVIKYTNNRWKSSHLKTDFESFEQHLSHDEKIQILQSTCSNTFIHSSIIMNFLSIEIGLTSGKLILKKIYRLLLF